MDSVGFYLLLNLLLTLTFVAVDSTKLEDKNKDRHKAEKDVSCSSTNLYYNEPITQDPFIVVHSTPCFMDKDETRSVTFFICDSNCINCNRHCIVNTANCKADENMICYCQKNSENGNVLITVKVPIPDTDQCLLGQLYNNTSLLNITKLLKVENGFSLFFYQDSISPGKDEKDTTEGSTSPGKDGKDMTEGSTSPGKDEKDTTEGSASPGKDEKNMTEMKALVKASIIGPLCSIGIITVLATLIAVCYCRKQCWKYPICFCNQKQVCQHSGEKDEGDDNNEQSLRHEDTEPTTTLNDRRGESADPKEMKYVERQEKRQVFKVIDLHEESEYFKLEDENDNANNNCAVTSRPNLNETTTVNSREVYDISINV